MAKVAVLVIDDFALKPIASPHDDDLHEIVAARYEKLPTVITSNLASEEWQEAFSNNKMLGLATVDRLMHGAYCVALEGRSHRSPRVDHEAETTRPATPDTSAKPAAGNITRQRFADSRDIRVVGQAFVARDAEDAHAPCLRERQHRLE